MSPPADTKLVLVQRSCGYALRPTLGIEDIARVVDMVRRHGPPGCVVAVDNCYGELTDVLEPCAVSPSAFCSLPCIDHLLLGQPFSSNDWHAGRTHAISKFLFVINIFNG